MNFVSTLAIVILATLASGQTIPNFSGTWALKVPPTVARPPSEVVLLIEQDDTTLIQRLDGSALMFRLDGDQTTNSMMSTGGAIELKCTIRWEGRSLVIDMRSESQGVVTQVLSLSADGKDLTIETVRLTQNGERRGTLSYGRR